MVGPDCDSNKLELQWSTSIDLHFGSAAALNLNVNVMGLLKTARTKEKIHSSFLLASTMTANTLLISVNLLTRADFILLYFQTHTDDLRGKIQLVGSKLSNFQRRCMPAPTTACSNTPPSNNSRESEISSLNFGISETSAYDGQIMPYDPSRYEDDDNSEQSRKARVESVRTEIKQWKKDHKKKTGHRNSQSTMSKVETGARSKSRLVSALEKLEVEYKQLQKDALERDKDGSWESINISRPASSKVSVGIQSGEEIFIYSISI